MTVYRPTIRLWDAQSRQLSGAVQRIRLGSDRSAPVSKSALVSDGMNHAYDGFAGSVAFAGSVWDKRGTR